jgi:DNA-binding NarL/FixJ family response regulator
MNNAPIRIILVDDHKLVRESWKSLLEFNPVFRVIADFEDGRTAIDKSPDLHPDIMLVDINMAPINGFAVTAAIMNINPSIKIIGLSVNNQPGYAQKMLELGARGYLTKTCTIDEITQGILAVQEGDKYVCEEVRRKMT